jgi:DNA-binding winged helix-turn-helix (wHTH) protein
LLAKHALLDDVWGHQFVSDSVLKTAISDLRATLHDDAKQPRYIETVQRRGYRFIGIVTPTVAAEARPDVENSTGVRLPAWSPIGREGALERLDTA